MGMVASHIFITDFQLWNEMPMQILLIKFLMSTM